MLGKADTVDIREPGEPKRTETKRHLLMTVAEAYALFMGDHPDLENARSMFWFPRNPHKIGAYVNNTPTSSCSRMVFTEK